MRRSSNAKNLANGLRQPSSSSMRVNLHPAKASSCDKLFLLTKPSYDDQSDPHRNHKGESIAALAFFR